MGGPGGPGMGPGMGGPGMGHEMGGPGMHHEGGPGMEHGMGPEGHGPMVEHLAAELGLTPEQKEKLKT